MLVKHLSRLSDRLIDALCIGPLSTLYQRLQFAIRQELANILRDTLSGSISKQEIEEFLNETENEKQNVIHQAFGPKD